MFAVRSSQTPHLTVRNDHLEAAENHALGVEWNFALHRVRDALDRHDLLHHAVAMGAGAIDDTGKYHRFDVPELDAARKRGAFAVRHVVAGTFVERHGAMLHPDLTGLVGHFPIRAELALRYRHDKSIDVSHMHFPRVEAALFAGESALDRCEVDFRHLHHGAHGAVRFRAVGIAQHFEQTPRKHLPGQAELVLQPATLAFAAALGQSGPVVIDFFLGLAGNLKRDRFAELESRTAVQAGEFLSVQFEVDGQHRARCAAVGFLSDIAETNDRGDLGILEHGGVEIHRFFGILVEPETGRDLLLCNRHDIPP